MFFSKSELTSVATPGSLIPKCEKCRLYTQCKSPKLKHSGKGNKKILIILDGVTQKDDDLGMLGTGDAEILFKRILKPVGIDYREDCWVTAASICGNPKLFPAQSEIERIVSSCRPNLINLIKELNPEIIVPAGSLALKSLLGHVWPKKDLLLSSQDRWSGWQIPCQSLNTWICPIYNPMQVEKEKNPIYKLYLNRSVKNLEKLIGIRPWLLVPDWKKEVQVLTDEKNIIKNLKYFKTKDSISFDYETNCLKPDNVGTIYACSISDGTTTIAFPLRTSVHPYLKDILFDKNIKKSGWNIQFEDRWTEAVFGKSVKGWDWDGMVNNHLIDTRDDINSLKFQAFVRLGVPAYTDDVEDFFEGDGGYGINRINEIGWSRLLLYNGLDSLLENKITKIQKKILGVK